MVLKNDETLPSLNDQQVKSLVQKLRDLDQHEARKWYDSVQDGNRIYMRQCTSCIIIKFQQQQFQGKSGKYIKLNMNTAIYNALLKKKRWNKLKKNDLEWIQQMTMYCVDCFLPSNT